MNRVKLRNQPKLATAPHRVERQIYGLRGATTVDRNTAPAIAQAVDELLNALEAKNPPVPKNIISVIFSVTSDLDAVFPAAVARQRPGWSQIPLLDVQHMTVTDSLERCIRVLIHLDLTLPPDFYPVYLRQAAQLRPDLAHPD